MFEDLNWKGAIRRAALAAGLYVLFIYVMTVAFPETFGANTNVVSTLVVAAAFFLISTPFFAFAERRKRRRLAELNAQKKGKSVAKEGNAKASARKVTAQGSGAESGEEDEAAESDLRGRHNPNTSRRKAARRRRR